MAITDSKIGKTYTWNPGLKKAIQFDIDKLSSQPSKVSFFSKTTKAGSVELMWTVFGANHQMAAEKAFDELKVLFPEAKAWSWSRRRAFYVRFYPAGFPLEELWLNGSACKFIREQVARKIGYLVMDNLPQAKNVIAVAREIHREMKNIEDHEQVKFVYTSYDMHKLFEQVCSDIDQYVAKTRKDRATGRISVHVTKATAVGDNLYTVELTHDVFQSQSTVQPDKVVTTDLIKAANTVADWVAQGHKIQDYTARVLAVLMVKAYTQTINDRAANWQKISK